MKHYFHLSIIVFAIVLTGCSAPFVDPPAISPDQKIDVLDITGSWKTILHYEVLDVMHVEHQITIQRMDCMRTKCTLIGHVERDNLGHTDVLNFDFAEYYPESHFARIEYRYQTIQTFGRTVQLFIDQFDLNTTPARNMAGHFIVYAHEAPPIFFDQEDKRLLEASNKGKAAHAGQITARLIN